MAPAAITTSGGDTATNTTQTSCSIAGRRMPPPCWRCQMSRMLAYRLSAVLVVVSYLSTAVATSGFSLPPDVISVFELDHGVMMASTTTEPTFQRIINDVETGKVYVGATNRLYQLSHELGLEQSVVTGPLPDNPMCPPPTADCQCFGPSCSNDFAKTPMDASSMALVIDRRNRRLIACTDLYQGHCDRHQLENITTTDPPVWAMVVPNDRRSAVVAFVAPGPPNPASTDALYVSASRGSVGLPAYRDVVPSIGVRNLVDLDLVSDDILTPSRLDVEVQQRDRFLVDFRYGFSSLGFSYFVSVQRRSATADDSDQLVTRISRICQNDRSMRSYAELPLVCRDPRDLNGGGGGLLTAASIVHPGSDLARSLGLTTTALSSDVEHVLVAVFSARAGASSSHGPSGDQGSSSGGPTSLTSSSSVLCVYPMKEIRRRFIETIQNCFRGVGHTGPDHYVQPKACYKTPFDIGDDYCGDYDINHPVVGTDSVSRDAAISWPNVTMTSLAVTTTANSTVAFVATHDGQIKKVVLESGSKAIEYDSVQLEPGALIKRDTAFDQSHQHLYAMTNSRVYRMAVQNCSRHTSCEECLGDRDPYCGWCSTLRRCTVIGDCSGEMTSSLSSSSSSSWLSHGRGVQCTRIVKISTSHAHRHAHSSSVVVLTVQNLPTPSSSATVSLPVAAAVYECVFSGHGVTRNTAVARLDRLDTANTSMRCELPPSGLLPNFPPDSDHMMMSLSVTLSGQPIVSTNFTFYDCTLHTTCTRCTESSFPCTWCVARHRCSNNREECKSDILITGRRVRGRSDTPGPEFCPRIEVANSGLNSSAVLVPSSTETTVQIKALHLQNVHRSLKCVFDVNGGVEREATIVNLEDGTTYIRCQPVLFQYSSDVTPYVVVPLSVVWNDDEMSERLLDNPRNAHVRVYKCSAMAKTCGHCRSVDMKFSCGWCSASRTCSVESNCVESESMPWLQRHQTCPDPTITSIHPQSGPVDGATRLTVTGVNLGISSSDTFVSIGNVDCYNVQYLEPTSKFVCTTGWSDREFIESVLVSMDNKFTAVSPHSFSYVQPLLIDFYPVVGPLSGGTRVTLVGTNLDAGVKAALTFKDPDNRSLVVNCAFVERHIWNTSVCVTSSGVRPFHARTVHFSIDNSTIPNSVPAHGFLVLPDPVIRSVTPDRTIISGGINLTVTGNGLDIVTKPQLIVYAREGVPVTTLCDVISSREMACTTPSVRAALSESLPLPFQADNNPVRLSYGFVLDGVSALLNISNSSSSSASSYRQSGSAMPSSNSSLVRPIVGRDVSTPAAASLLGSESDNSASAGMARYILVFPDPEFEVFDGIKQFYYIKNEYLTINGQNINLALRVSDIRVMLGNDIECVVTSLSISQLTCLPNTSVVDTPTGRVDVVIFIGDRQLRFHIGQLEFVGSLSVGSAEVLSLPVIIGIAVGSSIFLITIICLIGVAYTIKSRESVRVMKRMRNQMDVLEARVAKECKEAFAELQTDINEVTNDILSSTGLPFRDYWSYSLRVLFPNEAQPGFLRSSDQLVYVNGHGAHTIPSAGHSDEAGLRLFNQLLANKVFLLLFVRTLEHQKDFVISKKVYFASLLSLVLHSRFDYYTDVLKTLLADLIDRAMQGRCPPKILLRRTESVAEKLLTNWFTFLLYRFLRDSAGEPLFLLYRAMKQQIEKGPVDAVTGEAKYSLSEGRLIRQQLDYQIIHLNVIDAEYSQQHHSEYHVVRVLDCDTVCQVKEKILDAIYRNVPYSTRPSSGDLNLEWRTGVTLILNDIDSTSRTATNGSGETLCEARRMNTLKHYGLTDGAVVALVAKEMTLSSTASSYCSNSLSSRNGFSRLPRHTESQPLAESNGHSPYYRHDSAIVSMQATEKYYHLVRPHDADAHRGERGSKMVSEIYLTRLLSTKGTLQQYVDDLFATVFSTTSRGSVLPTAIKYMFDFLDDQALLHGVMDTEVVHLWKSNSLPLRFWVNVMKNPDFVFDIQKSSIVDSCLSVVAQTFMDSCSTSDQKLGKDSPSCKLLYAKEIPKYKNWVERYYEDIRKMPSITEQDMAIALYEESKAHENTGVVMSAVKEIYTVALTYNTELMRALEDDEFAVQHGLAFRLDQVHTAMNITF